SLMNAFRKGLGEVGIIEGQNVRIEDRAADGHYDRLPALAAELVEHRVAVIAANFLPAALAAKAATQTIPIIFLSGSDPIGAGLVSSIKRPTGSVTPCWVERTLAAGYGVPTMYPLSQSAAAGGLMSYGGSLSDAFLQAGVYVAKFLKGAKPADLPV